MSSTYNLTPSCTLFHADCRDALRVLPDNCIDAVCTDPPYHLTSVVKRFGGANAAPAKHGTDGLYARQSAGFMGKQWDGGDIAFTVELWTEVLRVLKPGGHCVAFGASRGYHRMACAIEDAGFEIRDSLMWVYATGFPKSHQMDRHRGEMICGCETEPPSECGVRCVSVSDVSATDRVGEERAEVLQSRLPEQSLYAQGTQTQTGRNASHDRREESSMERWGDLPPPPGQLCVSALPPLPGGLDIDGTDGRLCDGTSSSHGAMDRQTVDANGMRSPSGSRSAKQSAQQLGNVAGQSKSQTSGAWPHCGRCGKPIVTRGLGTALKPAFEPIVLARKPLSEGTVAANVLRWRTGALNIDACRIVAAADDPNHRVSTGGYDDAKGGMFGVGTTKRPENLNASGRWPANLVLSYPEDTFTVCETVTEQQRKEIGDWLVANSEHVLSTVR